MLVLKFALIYMVFSDFRKLHRDFPEVKPDLLISQCKDLGMWWNAIHGTRGLWSLERLVKLIVNVFYYNLL